ncbi:CAP domain-containing protein [Shinella sp. CPCC 101442]|uniref:CAP domain-containing protein n=1 Tax=Shinella sp. CPCC 101442 TaxID=2932265 RepID=UPI0021524A54|nr:CAP domain-containing protein [Shinella sp. CPCC 101442]MCR6499670.1 CAP domain-containing protein [Shinella sp. CPCC 101442]
MANMTPQEQLMLELVNRARMDPAGEAKRFDIALNEGVPTDRTISTAPKQVLAGNDALARSADKHSQWMLGNNRFEHQETANTPGFTGVTPSDRIKAAGYNLTGNWSTAENIAVRGTSETITAAMRTEMIINQHADLFVDENYPGRGHRTNILSEAVQEMGIGQRFGPFTFSGGGSSFNSSMVTQNFASQGNKIFVTGVVYKDKVIADDFFSVGEQVANVGVTSKGAVSDKTGAGGGYELLYDDGGSKTVHFALSSGKVSVGLTLGSSNVKVDVVNGTEVWSNTSVRSVSDNVKELHVLGILKTNLTGADGSQKLFGNGAANVLKGLDGNDTLLGAGGGDRLEGGAGTDTASYETSRKGVTANLASTGSNTNDARKDVYVSIENLTGSKFVDTLTGDDGKNTLSGLAGNDVLKGGNGNDKLHGGSGADDLTGGSGADRFIFKALSDSKVASSGRDTIFDFSHSGGDRIDLSDIDAIASTAKNDAFTFIGEEAFSGKAGELRFVTKASDTYIYANVDKDKTAEFALHLDDKVTLVKGDFIL